MIVGRNTLHKESRIARSMAKNQLDHLISNLRRVTSRRTFDNAEGKKVLPMGMPVALMFTDIERFTPKAMRMGKDIIEPLGLYFSVMSDCISNNGGDIDKFIGDGMFAYFHDLADPAGAANMALDATLEMMERERDLCENSEEWAAMFRQRPDWPQHQRFRTRIGLHWGGVIAGPIGSLDRADNTLMGDNVNLAARIESLNKSYNAYVLMTDSFFHSLSAERRGRCRLLDRVTVVGRETSPLEIFTVDPDPLPAAFIAAFSEAMGLYFAGDWHLAHKGFTKAGDILRQGGLPEDGPTRAFLDRIALTNQYWKKAVRNLSDHVPDVFTPETARAVSEVLSNRDFAAPMDWPGYWRHERK